MDSIILQNSQFRGPVDPMKKTLSRNSVKGNFQKDVVAHCTGHNNTSWKQTSLIRQYSKW